jgi:hypothetical protein
MSRLLEGIREVKCIFGLGIQSDKKEEVGHCYRRNIYQIGTENGKRFEVFSSSKKRD